MALVIGRRRQVWGAVMPEPRNSLPPVGPAARSSTVSSDSPSAATEGAENSQISDAERDRLDWLDNRQVRTPWGLWCFLLTAVGLLAWLLVHFLGR